jgi:DNA topoisomerase-2
MVKQIKQKSIEEQFKKLNEVEHVLLRPGRYIGSITPHTELAYVFDKVTKRMVKEEVTYNPGFLKLFDEVISNSIDHSKRPEGKDLDIIRVDFDQAKGEISIYDNGGIPVIKHKEYNQWIPEMIFELRAGSNFDDDDQSMLTGQNGEGAALTNIFSHKFVVETCDGKNKFKMVFENNSQNRHEAKVTPAEGAKGYTRITYSPDFDKLGCAFTDDNLKMLLKRVVDVAGLNTHLKVYWDGERIPTRSFKDYVELYTGADGDYAYDETENWKVAVCASDDGFQHVSFVNGTNTKEGGTHILYAGMQIWERIREYIKKKNKIDIKPSELRQHMTLFIDCSMVNPRYSSQTKENLITEVKDYKTSYEVTDKMINKIVKSSIIQSILDWAQAKALQEEMKELRKMNKDAAKTDPKRVDKFSDAIEKKDRFKCELYLAEGDSARKSIQEVRGKNPYIGSYALRGKLLNVTDCKTEDILGNNEIANLLTIIGLKIGEKVKSVDELRFGKIVMMTDQDLDGHHISSLLFNFFAKFWPELFKLGVIYKLTTPLIIAKTKTEEFEFMDDTDYESWSKTAPKHTSERFKGLGTFTSKEFGKVISNRENYLTKIDTLELKDFNAINLAFSGSEADARKEWLGGASYFHEYD